LRIVLCLRLRRGARADPRDDHVVIRVASGDAFDHRGIEFGVLLRPCPPVGVQESRSQQERRSLVAIGQRMVLREMCDEDGGLVEQFRVGVFASERGERGMDRRLG
jgi:hypothetical protein